MAHPQRLSFRRYISSSIFPYIVQSDIYDCPNYTNNHTTPFSLTNTPEVGNLLLAITHTNQFTENRDLTPPDLNWVKVDGIKYDNFVGMDIWYKEVISGDGKDYVFTFDGTEEFSSGILYEIENVDLSDPINQYGIIGRAAASSVITPSVTPDKLRTLAISAICTVNGSIPDVNVNSVSTGWEKDLIAKPTWVTTFSSYKIDLNEDTTTAISNTFTLSADSGGAGAVIILLNPDDNKQGNSNLVSNDLYKDWDFHFCTFNKRLFFKNDSDEWKKL